MSALFDFNAFLTVVLLTVCTCTYIKLKAPAVLAQRTGCGGDPLVASACNAMHYCAAAHAQRGDHCVLWLSCGAHAVRSRPVFPSTAAFLVIC